MEVECITCGTSFIPQHAYDEICTVCKNKNDDKVDKVNDLTGEPEEKQTSVVKASPQKSKKVMHFFICYHFVRELHFVAFSPW